MFLVQQTCEHLIMTSIRMAAVVSVEVILFRLSLPRAYGQVKIL